MKNQPSRNLLRNGRFEENDQATGWSVGAAALVVRENPKEGNRCLQVKTDVPGWAMQSQDCQLPAGAARVRLSGWMRTENVVTGKEEWEKARILLTFHDAQGELAGGYPPSFNVAGTTPWTRYERDYDMPAGAVRLTLTLGLHNATGTVWYDDLLIEAYDQSGRGLNPITESRTDTKNWYPLDAAPDDYKKPSIIDFSRLLHQPAGRHGFVTVRKAHFAFQDGTPVRFWGTNVVDGNVFMDKKTAERTAARLAKWGCNMVRLHHMDADWSRPNIFGNKHDNTQLLSPESLDKLDYFIYQCKQHGIYIYMDLLVHRKFGPEDGVMDWQSLGAGAKIIGHYNRRLIELQKKYAHDLLTHQNPYTKIRYVDEPAIAMMEIINESTLFWVGGYSEVPESYLRELQDLFDRWCREKGRSRPAGRIPDLLGQKNPTVARFLYELQTASFKEIQDYLRSIGVKVPIAGSNHWENWVGDILSNVQLDYLDRHAYWDHPQGGYSPTNRFTNAPMVKSPLGSLPNWLARQHVEDKPFIVTEWNCCWMNEYITEGPLLMAVYGSLQGWDGILQFDYSGGDWSPRMEGCFNIGNKPHVMAAWLPAALLFHRGDVPADQNAFVAPFQDKDIDLQKPMGEGIAPGQPLIQRVTNRLDAPKATAPSIDANEFRSRNRLLRWNRSDGVFVIESPRTQGALGFLGGKRIETPAAVIQAQTPFCQILLSMLGDDPPRFRHALLTAVARAENSGTVYNPSRTSLLNDGKPPILMEPVEATITLKIKQTPKIYVLDHHGRRNGKTVAVQKTEGGWQFTIGKEAAFWYEVIAEA